MDSWIIGRLRLSKMSEYRPFVAPSYARNCLISIAECQAIVRGFAAFVSRQSTVPNKRTLGAAQFWLNMYMAG